MSVILLAASFTQAGNASAEEDTCLYIKCPTPTTLPDGYRYIYENGVFHGSAGASSGTVRGVRVEYLYEVACNGNEVLDPNGAGGGLNCAGAVTTCPTGQMRMWTFTRPAGTLQTPLRQPGSRCIGIPQTIPLADVQTALLRYLKDAHLPKPTIITAPPTTGLVNLPQIFATTDNPPVTLSVTVPLPAELTAEPHYRWDFGDGTTGPDTPGTPYQPGVLPKDHPNHYLQHTYRTPGTITATLTVTWQATFTITGIAGEFSIPDITFTTSRSFPIHQARSQLVDSP